VLRDAAAGAPIEYETLGPYLSSYIHVGGRMTQDNLIPEDAIGLALAVTFRKLLPHGMPVSLVDEYNGALWSADAAARDDQQPSFSAATKRDFMDSMVQLFKDAGALAVDATEDKDYLLLPESAKIEAAEKLVKKLEASGNVARGEGDELLFVNEHAENPLHRSFHLRTKRGRWLCEALDASSFLEPHNRHITHIVVLPEYMKEQQDKVWEILRVLGIAPSKYHNIFYDKSLPAAHIQQAIERAFYVVWSAMER
jgi:hypothetical protein